MRLVVLGRQGAGKGTQCARIARRLGVAHVSTGAVFRAAVEAGSGVGRQVAEFVVAGELVPDDLAVAVVAETLNRQTGFVLDGFPRTVRQAEIFNAFLAPASIDVALDIRVAPVVALRRLLCRRVCSDCGAVDAVVPNTHGLGLCSCCGGSLARRSDDTEPAILRRLALYEEQTRPLLGWFAAAGVLRTVDGQGPVDVVARRIESVILRGNAEDEGRWALARFALGSAVVDTPL